MNPEFIYTPDYMRSFKAMKRFLIVEEGRQTVALDSENRLLCSPAYFEPGWINMTIGAREILERHGVDVQDPLIKFLNGNWGDLEDEDKRLNDLAVRGEEHLLGRYNFGDDSIYIETEWNRSYTTIMDVWER